MAQNVGIYVMPAWHFDGTGGNSSNSNYSRHLLE